MLLYILAAVGFWGLAKKKNLSPIYWAIIAVLTAVLSQFVGGLIVGWVNPQMASSYGAIWVIAIFSSLVGLAIVWIVLNSITNKNEVKVKSESSELLDDKAMEDL